MTTDAEAFAWFFAAEYPRVVRSLSHLVRREDAEDVAQEAFARLHQHWAKVSHYDQPEAWVRRIRRTPASGRRCGRCRPASAPSSSSTTTRTARWRMPRGSWG